jgi:hypothetical protein
MVKNMNNNKTILSTIIIAMLALAGSAAAADKITITSPTQLIQSPIAWFNSQPAGVQMAYLGLTGLIGGTIALLILLIFGKSLLQVLGAKKTKDSDMSWSGLQTIGALIGVIILMGIALAFYWASLGSTS